MRASQSPVIPVKQSTVIIAGFEIIVVLLADGRVAAAFRMFCEMLHLDYSTQVQKVRAHRTIGDCLISAFIETVQGKQEANVIIAEAIPIWLAGIHPNRVSPEARKILDICQLDAVRTIRQKFFLEVEAESGQTLPPKEEPAQTLPPKEEPAQAVPPKEEPEPAALPPEEESSTYWDHMALGQIGLEQEVRELLKFVRQAKADREQIIELFQRHQKRLDRLEAQVEALTEQVKHLSAGTLLTAVHQAQLQVLIRAWEFKSGQPASAIEQELAAAFGVETVSQITEAAWGEMMAGFRDRLGWSV